MLINILWTVILLSQWISLWKKVTQNQRQKYTATHGFTFGKVFKEYQFT